jgi:ATP-dependent protease ClpP protease subunit
LNNLAEKEEFVLEITSYGGSVTAGLAICNLLKKASAQGHKTTAHVIGIAASMASAIACACDEL